MIISDSYLFTRRVTVVTQSPSPILTSLCLFVVAVGVLPRRQRPSSHLRPRDLTLILDSTLSCTPIYTPIRGAMAARLATVARCAQPIVAAVTPACTYGLHAVTQDACNSTMWSVAAWEPGAACGMVL